MMNEFEFKLMHRSRKTPKRSNKTNKKVQRINQLMSLRSAISSRIVLINESQMLSMIRHSTPLPILFRFPPINLRHRHSGKNWRAITTMHQELNQDQVRLCIDVVCQTKTHTRYKSHRVKLWTTIELCQIIDRSRSRRMSSTRELIRPNRKA